MTMKIKNICHQLLFIKNLEILLIVKFIINFHIMLNNLYYTKALRCVCILSM